MSFKWFGLGGSKKDEKELESSSSPIDAPFPTSNSTSISPPSNRNAQSGETVQSMLSNIKFDPATLHPFKPNQQGTVDYMFIDDVPFGSKPAPHPTGSFGPFPMRTNSDKLLYGSGTAYLIGLSSGGAYGFIKGLGNSNATTMKLRINSVLNSCTRYGPWAGNSMGVLTMMWAMVDSGLHELRGGSDYYNHISGAFLTGALFKSTAGIRPAFVMGSLLASLVAGYGAIAFASEHDLRLPRIRSVGSTANT